MVDFDGFTLDESVCPFVVRPSLLSFPYYNFSECEWIYKKLGVCIDIVEICLGITNGFFLLSACHMSVVFGFGR